MTGLIIIELGILWIPDGLEDHSNHSAGAVARLQALVLLAFFWGLQSAAQNHQIH